MSKVPRPTYCAARIFQNIRPKIIVVEAIKPLTLAPAWDEWEPLLARHGYSYVWDDELNRYYVAEEAREIASRLAAGPKWYADGPQIGNHKPAADDPTHPDHRLALLLRGADMARLPLDRAALAGTADRRPARPRPACDRGRHRRQSSERLFGPSAAVQQIAAQPDESIRDVYRRIIDSDAFRAACGRIAASYAW